MEETKDGLPLFMVADSYVAAGEENDVRVAKRNVCNFERFLQAGKPQIEALVKRGLNADCSEDDKVNNMTLLEVFDVMRNHVTDEIAD
jgi:hypothetical protein